jgi:hypothetical protein
MQIKLLVKRGGTTAHPHAMLHTNDEKHHRAKERILPRHEHLPQQPSSQGFHNEKLRS